MGLFMPHHPLHGESCWATVPSKAQSKSITTDSTPLCNLALCTPCLVAIIKAPTKTTVALCCLHAVYCCSLVIASLFNDVCCHADTRGSALQEGCSRPWVVSHSLLPSAFVLQTCVICKQATNGLSAAHTFTCLIPLAMQILQSASAAHCSLLNTLCLWCALFVLHWWS